jgi:multicomponent Na+:H+ antiporter subunit G
MDWWSHIKPWLADVLVVLGVAVMSIGVFGMIRMPDLYTKLHAASKAVVLGAIALAAASAFTAQPEIVYRVALISVLLLLTTPIASHVIAKAERDAESRGDEHEHQSGGA